MKRIPSLDGLRALSILLVVVGHSLHGKARGAEILGVHIFFVISGYLITTLLQNEHDRHGSISLRAFYYRRAFRIFPAAFAYILVVALLAPEVRSALPYALTYTISWHLYRTPVLLNHLWSLSCEEQFYLLWPLALAIGYRYRARIAWAAMIAAAIYRLVLAFHAERACPYIHFSFPGAMDSIAAGCLLAIYGPEVKERFGWMADAPAIVIALPITAFAVGGLWWGDTVALGARLLVGLWGIVPILLALWLFLLVERRDWVFNNRLASCIGVLSYSLYLWQQPFTTRHEYPVILAVALSLGMAVASYLMVERPLLKLGAARLARQACHTHEPPPPEDAAAITTVKLLSAVP